MAKTTKKHFEIFKEECQKWIERYALLDWEIVFEHTALNGSDATVSVNSNPSLATIALSTKVEWEGLDFNMPFEDYIKFLAKHETTHLLTARIVALARDRYVSEKEIDKEEELLGNKLNQLIK